MECKRNKIKYPFINHFNIKGWARNELHKKKHCGVNSILEHLGMKFIGTPHYAIDDAVNEVRICEKLKLRDYFKE